jgi:chorismate-pyruvate lyase
VDSRQVLVSGPIHVSSGYAQAVMSGADPHEVASEAVSDPAALTPARAIEDMIRSYFTAWAQRPSRLGDVDVAALTPLHRALLVNDGTVTRLVEASVLEPVEVDTLDQQTVEVDDQRWLDLPATPTPVLRRRVAIRGRASGRLYVLAESLLVTSRLPKAFASALSHNPKGLGALIDEMRLSTRRELLWFGSAQTPAWAGDAVIPAPLLTRTYRIIIGGCPAILITESFPIADASSAPAADGASRPGSASLRY